MADEIEFLDADAPSGEDEQLPVPTGRDRPGTPRIRRIGAVAALVVVVGAGLIARAATNGGSDSAAPAPTTRHTPTAPSATAPDRSAAADHSGGHLSSPADIFCPAPVPPHGVAPLAGPTSPRPRSDAIEPETREGLITCTRGDPTRCTGSGVVGCTLTGEVPMAVVQAVRKRFPAARYVSSQTQVTRKSARVLFRYVNLRAKNRTTVQVLVQQRTFDAGAGGSLDDGSRQIVRAVHRGPRVDTVVQITEPSGTRPGDMLAAELAADPGLLAVG